MLALLPQTLTLPGGGTASGWYIYALATDPGARSKGYGRQLLRFVDGYLANDPMHVQFNIMSADTMRAAQKDPDSYRDMLVRVAGYSAYFVELGDALQKDLIQRTELHF